MNIILDVQNKWTKIIFLILNDNFSKTPIILLFIVLNIKKTFTLLRNRAGKEVENK